MRTSASYRNGVAPSWPMPIAGAYPGAREQMPSHQKVASTCQKSPAGHDGSCFGSAAWLHGELVRTGLYIYAVRLVLAHKIRARRTA